MVFSLPGMKVLRNEKASYRVADWGDGVPGVPVFTASARRPMIVVKTARGLLDTQRVVLHNFTQVMTYCCPVKMNVLHELLI